MHLVYYAKTNIKYFFREEFGHLVFGAIMSVNRFGFLHAKLSFDNIDTKHQRWLHDQSAAVRDLFKNFNDHACSVLEPDDFLITDETLYSCRNQM